jgi:sugar phosphate isomerase/epimerase
MEASIISDEVSQDLGIAIEAATRHGFAGLEIRSVDGCPPHLLDDAAVLRIRRRLQAAGLAVSAFCPPALKSPIPLDGSSRAAAAAVVRQALRHAALLGTRAVRMFSFYRDGQVPEPERAAETARAVLERVDVPDGVRLVLETGTRTNTPTLALAARFLDVLGDERVGILWDPGNTVFSGFAQYPFADFEETAGRIEHVHVKDPQGTRRYVALGEGDLPWPEIMRHLDRAGYHGWLTLETHWRVDRDLTGPERDEPWGEGISAGGLAASEICMRTMADWLAGLRAENSAPGDPASGETA